MDNLKKKIERFNENLWKPKDLQYEKINTHSWFDMEKGINNEPFTKQRHQFICDKLQKVDYKCKKIMLIPTTEQKRILLEWMDAYIKMYNQTIKLFRQKYYNNEKVTINFKSIRTNYMFDIKESICSKIDINKHILDCAIKDACTSYKSALTNLKNGNITHFRLRYIKTTKRQKILKLEKLLFTKDRKTFCKTQLGDTIETTDGSDFSDVETDCTLLYKHKRFTLLIPIKIIKNEVKNKRKVIAIDPGIRTPYVGYSTDHVLNIGSNMQKEMSKIIKQIDKIHSSDIHNKKKKKAVGKRYSKIENMVDDMQWKTINYLTTNYDTILIGNMSTKDIVNNTCRSKLKSITKRLALHIKLYIFRERLKFKCSMNGIKYRNVDEMYTSKTCTLCGTIKNDLGGNKIYSCDNCRGILERDVNGARNIFMVDIKK